MPSCPVYCFISFQSGSTITHPPEANDSQITFSRWEPIGGKPYRNKILKKNQDEVTKQNNMMHLGCNLTCRDIDMYTTSSLKITS